MTKAGFKVLLILALVGAVFSAGVPGAFGQESELDTARQLDAQVIEQLSKNNYQTALMAAKTVVAIRERVQGLDHPDLAESLINLAIVYQGLGAAPESEPLLKRALAITEKNFGPEDQRVAAALINLARYYQEMGNSAPAEPLLKRTLAILEKIQGPESMNVATTLNNLAMLYKEMGLYTRAEPLFKRALAIKTKVKGPDDPETAISMINLGEFYHQLKKYPLAEAQYLQGLAILEKKLGPDHVHVAAALNNLAVLYEHMEALSRAIQVHERTLAITEKALGPEHPNMARGMHNLAVVHAKMGTYPRAETLFQKALAIKEKTLGPEHPSTINTLDSMIELYKKMGAYSRAEPLAKRALALGVASGDGQRLSAALHDLQMVLDKEDQLDAAIFFGKLNINVVQWMRGRSMILPEAEQRAFIAGKESMYKELADQLNRKGRRSEAQDILSLASAGSEVEVLGRNRKKTADLRTARPDFNKFEAEQNQRYGDSGGLLVAVAGAIAQTVNSKTPQEPAQRKALLTQLDEARGQFLRSLDEIITAFADRKTEPAKPSAGQAPPIVGGQGTGS